MSDVAKTVTCPYCPPNTDAKFKEVDSAGYRLFDCGEHVFRYDYRPETNPASGHPAFGSIALSVERSAPLEWATASAEAGWTARDEEVKHLHEVLSADTNALVRLGDENKRLRAALEKIKSRGECSDCNANAIASDALKDSAR